MHAWAQSDFQKALSDWFTQCGRDLPWRSDPSLYKTVVSEFMLQQTQVKTVLPYFDRWMSLFPDFSTLASASEYAVLKAWEGLGYYRRARNLHTLAQAYIRAEPKPQTAAQWLRFKGVGDYTAAAIASLASGDPVPVVDGNVVRVLARVYAENDVFKDNATAVKAFYKRADALLNTDAPGVHNEAMMELGATVCTKHTPTCEACPVKVFCKAYACGNPADYPRLIRTPTKRVERHLAWCLEGESLVLNACLKNSARLANMLELPELSQLNLTHNRRKPISIKQRGISHERITESLYKIQATAKVLKCVERSKSLTLVPLSELDNSILSGPHRKWVTHLLKEARAL